MLAPLTAASLMILVAVTIVMLAQSVTLALLALGALPLLNVAATRFSQKMGPISFELQQELGGAVGRGRGDGVGHPGGEGLRRRGAPGASGSRPRPTPCWTEALAASRLRAGFLPLVDFLPAVALVVILWYGGHLVLDGEHADRRPRRVQLVHPHAHLAAADERDDDREASRMSASAGRVHEVLVTDPQIADAATGRRCPPGGGEVRFEGVSLRVPRRRRGARRARPRRSAPGEAVARRRRRPASGKTTVARLLPRFYDVDAGRVLIDGVDVRTLRVGDAARRRSGIVFEDTFLFSDTVRENIAFADPERHDGRRCGAPRELVGRGRLHRASCPTATTRSSASTGSRCRAGSASGSRSRAPCSPTRGC